MSFSPDMGFNTPVAAGDYVRAIGWLHPDHSYTKGEVSAEFLTRLKRFIELSNDSARALFFGAAGGFHTCEFCTCEFARRAHGTRNFGVITEDLLFVAPEMVAHYIEQHGYCPPPEFVSAVLRSPLPDTDEYQVISEPFWHLHRNVVLKMMQSAEKSHLGGSQAGSGE